MKTFYHLIRLFLSLGFALLFSCSSDEFTLTEENNTLVQRQNIANPYDQTGLLYSQIYHEYHSIHLDSIYSIDRIIAEVDKIVTLSAVYDEIMGVYSPIDNDDIENIVLNQNITLENYIQNSTLSTITQQRFIKFTDSLRGKTHNQIYDDIVDFEDKAIKDTLLTSDDKDILLNTCSILRYSLDNGDRDWDDDKSNIIKATLIGIQENSTKAIIMAVTVRIVIRQQTQNELQDQLSP
jgi:hypothetical protein